MNHSLGYYLLLRLVILLQGYKEYSQLLNTYKQDKQRTPFTIIEQMPIKRIRRNKSFTKDNQSEYSIDIHNTYVVFVARKQCVDMKLNKTEVIYFADINIEKASYNFLI